MCSLQFYICTSFHCILYPRQFMAHSRHSVVFIELNRKAVCKLKVKDKCLPVQETKETRFESWVKKIPWRRAWLPTPAFLPGESHGHRSLVGYSPWGRKESDTTKSDLALAYIHLQFLKFISHIDHYRVLRRVPCAIQ